MSRVSKAPEERRLEFVETAERLFFERGFDETAVSDIVKELNVAQGTFYCYFKNKEDVLAAVVHRNIAEAMDRIQTLNNEPCKNSTERLTRMVNTMLEDYSDNTKLATYVQKESNAGIHQKVVKQTIAHITPMLEEVMRKGSHSGVGDFLNVLDAQRTQFSLEEQLAQSETLSSTALVAVYKALDGGFESD